MLWFAMATDPATERQAPTWYVGKAEEFGQARGWLQVRSDAERPSEIRNSWSVWSTVEKVWKEAPDVKCIAVSATAGVVIQGPTPNNLLQDKLGEYRRVQLRVITERGVYEMVGMPNVMMWYAPGGTWNIGKRDELGQNRGWYQAVSKAISPEGISNWQVWDGANKKWEKAAELQAVSVGSRRVAFMGRTPNDLNTDKLEEYVRVGFQCHEGRAVYECVGNPERALWYAKPYWYIGQMRDVGKAQGWLCCKDDAVCPELVKANWRVGDGQQMLDAPEVKCIPVGAVTVMVAGETPNNLNSDKLGEFIRLTGRQMNGRPVYAQLGNDNRMLWYASGYWYLGKKDELGKSQGWLCVRDPAAAPELVQQIWRVGDGNALHDAHNVKCAAIGARAIEVLGSTVSNLHADKMGEFRMLTGQEVNGKPVYEKEPAVSHMVWASNGYWYVGKREELGKQAGWMQVRDSASLPEDISGTWQIWNQAEKKWMPSDGVKVIAVGNAQVHIAGPPPAACREHQAKLGDFLRVRGAEVNGHAVYQKSDADVLLWKASGTWYIGPSASRGKMAGFWRCKDGAAVPEAIQGSWEVGDGRNWHVAEGVRCMEFVIPRVVLRGATPEERHKDKLGTYVLCEGEVVNARACYEQEANPERMLWFLAPYWYVGKREEKGLGQGWVQVRSLASVPEQIHATWSIWNSAEKRWVEAPELRIVPDTEARALVQRPYDEAPPGSGRLSTIAKEADEHTPSAAIVSLAPSHAPLKRDVYLTHDGGVDGAGRHTQQRVAAVNAYLRQRGLTTWFDGERLQGNVVDKMGAGIDDSEVVAVFVTQSYIDRAGGRAGPHDNCKREFEYAERTKGVDKLVSVVFEPAAREPAGWRGSVGMVLGSRVYRDLGDDEGSAGWEAGLHQLYRDILALKEGDGRVEPPTMPALAPTEANAPAESPRPGTATAAGGMTMAQKVGRIKEELSLDPSLPIGRAVAEANETLGIDPVGSIAQQVEVLMSECSLDGHA